MDERLIWNFELSTDAPIDFNALPQVEKDDYKWEARFFWTKDVPIVLHGLTPDQLSLVKASFKTHQDIYVLTPNTPLNLKYRNNHLVYKPLVQSVDGLCAYGKKIKLDEVADEALLPETPGLTKTSLEALVHASGFEVGVFKEAVCFEFPTIPHTKLELSKINIRSTPVVGPRPNLLGIYFSACIEGKSQALVDRLRQLIMPTSPPCDYPSFLASEQLSC